MTEDEKEELVSRRVRRVSRVMAFTAIFYFGFQYLGGQLELPNILIPILDFLALFAFLWSLFEIWKIFKIIRNE